MNCSTWSPIKSSLAALSHIALAREDLDQVLEGIFIKSGRSLVGSLILCVCDIQAFNSCAWGKEVLTDFLSGEKAVPPPPGYLKSLSSPKDGQCRER